jgi:hypothetical protein
MPAPLSRRAFIRVAAAIGGLASFLGFERNASSTPPANPGPLLYDCCLGCLRLHKYMGLRKDKSFHVKGPTPIGDLGNDGTRYSFSAALINNVADNTLHVRDHIRKCEPITDQDTWPIPKKMTTTDPDALKKSIDRWIDIQSQLFNGMLLLYQMPDPIFDSSDDIRARSNDPEEYHRLAYCGVEFIKIESSQWPPEYQFTYDPVPNVPTPNSVPDSTIISSLIDLEWGFHKLAQAQMEIASFMPDHFNINAARACSGGGGTIK